MVAKKLAVRGWVVVAGALSASLTGCASRVTRENEGVVGGPQQAASGGEVRAVEPLQATQVANVIHTNHGDIQKCYADALTKGEQNEGEVRMFFIIGGEGQVTFAGLSSSSLELPEVEECIRGEILTWVFPQPVQGTEVPVEYAWKFVNTGQAEEPDEPEGDAKLGETGE